jgi:hypothetical protein
LKGLFFSAAVDVQTDEELSEQSVEIPQYDLTFDSSKLMFVIPFTVTL